MEPGVSLEAASLFLRGRGKAVYILPSSDPTLTLLLVGVTEYDDDEFHNHHHSIPQLMITCLALTQNKLEFTIVNKSVNELNVGKFVTQFFVQLIK
ncbi:hypothetical protein Hanom_Chr08g00703651 [Helianthus anomalus]